MSNTGYGLTRDWILEYCIAVDLQQNEKKRDLIRDMPETARIAVMAVRCRLSSKPSLTQNLLLYRETHYRR